MRLTGSHAGAIGSRLSKAGISSFDDCTRERLYALRDIFLDTCSPGAAKTYLSEFKSYLARYGEGRVPCKDYDKILRVKGGERPVKTYLTPEELGKVAAFVPLSKSERLVQNLFIISTRTGLRHSDVAKLRPESITPRADGSGSLTYVAEKTGITATLPVSADTIRRIKACAGAAPLSLMHYNRVLREICRESGIDTPVATHRGGKDHYGPKWEFVSSHTGRISFCTNLSRLGVALIDISRMAGHSSTAMTERYIVPGAITLPETAMAYLG